MKALQIAWKDTLMRLRDPRALVYSLAGPLGILLILGLVFGQRSLPPTDTVVVNLDTGQLGAVYVNALTSDQVKAYVKATTTRDETAARAAVDKGNVSAAVIIPAGFSEAIFKGETREVEIYADPGATIGPAVVRAVVDAINFSIAKNSSEVQVSLAALVQSGRITREQLPTVAPQLGQQLQAQASTREGAASKLTLNDEDVSATSTAPVLSYFAPAMLIFFLMLNAIRSGPHLLEEKENGTLSRLFMAPLTRSEVIAGKLMGDFAVSALQALVLVLGLTLIFGVNLGAPLAVLLLIVGVILSSIALGLLIAGVVRSANAVPGATQAVAMILGLVGGAFVPTDQVPSLRSLSLIAPNRWALDGFLTLAHGGGLADIITPLAILLGMTVLFALLSSRLLSQKLSVD